MPDRGAARQVVLAYKRQRCTNCGLSVVLDRRACGRVQCSRCQVIGRIDTNGNDDMRAAEAVAPS